MTKSKYIKLASTIVLKMVDTKKSLLYTVDMTVKNLTKTALMTALIIISGFIKIPTGITFVTMQVAVITLSGFLLGGVYGCLSVLIYVILGLVGVPVFTKGGGFWYVFEPSFGYLLGFIFAALAMGLLSKKANKFWHYALISMLGLVIIYTFALTYWYFMSKYYFDNPASARTLFVSMCAIFLPLDIAFNMIASVIALRVNKYQRKKSAF